MLRPRAFLKRYTDKTIINTWTKKYTNMKRVFDEKVLVEFSKQELYILKQLVLELLASDHYDSYTDDAKDVLNNIRNL